MQGSSLVSLLIGLVLSAYPWHAMTAGVNVTFANPKNLQQLANVRCLKMERLP